MDGGGSKNSRYWDSNGFGGLLTSFTGRIVAEPGAVFPCLSPRFSVSFAGRPEAPAVFRQGGMYMTVAFDGPVVLDTHFDKLRLKARGQVRDLYDLGGSLLIDAAHGLPAFAVGVPG